jgi:predicted KAP-like P-loop ATPase
MFKEERPIRSRSEDVLGRARFAGALADAISGWTESGSLVIGLYGTWGSGKSSILNLLKEHLAEQKETKEPTVIDFNAWMVSGQEQLLSHFFRQIAKELEIQDQERNDRKIAESLRIYGNLLLSFPDISQTRSVIGSYLASAGVLGLTIGFLVSKFVSSILGAIIFLVGLLSILTRLSGSTLQRLADFFQARSRQARKTIIRQKDEIIESLKHRKRKLLIVIDDVDRLTGVEIRQLIRLVKVNSDFPNTVYLLAFDRTIVEKNLHDTKGVSGRDYLEKIIQVSFDVPETNRGRVEQFLFEELDKVLASLPEPSQRYFDQERWTNLYHSGFRDFFSSIRNIKRYVNSLHFNLSMLVKDSTMEVNPIDFMAIECIRLFCPEYYHFIKKNKSLFAFVDSDVMSDHGYRDREDRLKQLNESLSLIPEEQQKSIKGILERIFPGTFDNTMYDSYWLSEWNKALRVKSPEFFDAYFTLTPGGDEESLTQHHMERLLNRATDSPQFEQELRKYLQNAKIRKVLERLQDFTSGDGALVERHIPNVIQALFNISDELPQEKTSMFDVGASMDIMRIAYQFGKRLNDPSRYKDIILNAIENSSSLQGPVEFVALETPREDSRKDHYVISEDQIGELQEACVEKIIEFETEDKLMNHPNLIFVLYRWKEWDSQERWRQFIAKATKSDRGFLVFLSKFVHEQTSHRLGDYAVKKERKFSYADLRGLTELKSIRSRVESIRESNSELTQEFKEVMDLVFTDIDKEVARTEKEKSTNT